MIRHAFACVVKVSPTLPPPVSKVPTMVVAVPMVGGGASEGTRGEVGRLCPGAVGGGVRDGVGGVGFGDAFPLSPPFPPLSPLPRCTLAVVSLVGRGREVGGSDGPGKGVRGCRRNDVMNLWQQKIDECVMILILE